jgi:Holliday junction resolvase RusA-like endonuclease
MTVELTFDAPPSVNNYYIRGRIISPKGRLWRDRAGWQLVAQKPKHISGPVTIDIALGGFRGDCDNRTKPAVDLLVRHGVIEDDNQKIVTQVKTYASSEVKGCRVRITETNL